MKSQMSPRLCWLEDPGIFAVNRLSAHSDHLYYESFETMEQRRQTLVQSLNGVWNFSYYENPKALPEDMDLWEKLPIPAGKICVPGHIELQGYGQIQYTNTAYPWDGHAYLRPPQIDWEHNAVGIYVRCFDLEAVHVGRRISLSFAGAERAIYVWLNGQFIGYAEDSFTPSEFDITEAVLPKENKLTVALFRHSSASWLEDQDFFRFSGLFRDVLLYVRPEGHLEDIRINTEWNPVTGEGEFDFHAILSGTACKRVKWELCDAEKKMISEGEIIKPAACEISAQSQRLSAVRPWEPDSPYLYQLTVQLFDEAEHLLEVSGLPLGFRHLEIKDKVLMLNGHRLLLNGVNRHEWSPEHGRAITEKEMRADIEIFKRNGINAVRTSHYPNQSLWYHLCDEAGIIVLDETNLETHGTCMKMGITEISWNIPGSDESWEAACLDRARSMYERDKNHPSILFWSAGNESHVGTVIQHMCEYFHKVDKNRLVHYEGVFYDRSFDFITDLESRMYASPDQVREYLEKNPTKPMILCEYMHCMGNSLGGFESYMRLREEFPIFAGGFIWDFIDQALYHDTPHGRQLGYGGDFRDRPTDYAFCGNGIVFADRREKPAMAEVRYWYLKEEARHKFDLENAAAKERCRIKVQALLEESADNEPEQSLYHIPQGPIGSSGLMESGGGTVAKTKPTKNAYLEVIHTDCNLGIKGEGFHYIFSFGEGGPTSLVIQGKEQLYRTPRPTVWRAPTENDIGCGFPVKSAVWLGADLYSRASECMVEEFGDHFSEILVPLHFAERRPARRDVRKVEIRYVYHTPTSPQATITVAYQVNAKGRIHVTLSYEGMSEGIGGLEKLPELPCFGLQLLTADSIEDFYWDGRGGETYPDRYKGETIGSHRETPSIPSYLVPQECGNHTETFKMEAGNMIFLMDRQPFHFSILPWTTQELANAGHVYELPSSSHSVIRILGAMRGVGGIDSWMSDVEEAYHIFGDRDIRYSFYLVPKRR